MTQKKLGGYCNNLAVWLAWKNGLNQEGPGTEKISWWKMATEIEWTSTDIKPKPHTHTQKSIKRVSCYRTSKSRVGIWYIYIYVDWL